MLHHLLLTNFTYPKALTFKNMSSSEQCSKEYSLLHIHINSTLTKIRRECIISILEWHSWPNSHKYFKLVIPQTKLVNSLQLRIPFLSFFLLPVQVKFNKESVRTKLGLTFLTSSSTDTGCILQRGGCGGMSHCHFTCLLVSFRFPNLIDIHIAIFLRP